MKGKHTTTILFANIRSWQQWWSRRY